MTSSPAIRSTLVLLPLLALSVVSCGAALRVSAGSDPDSDSPTQEVLEDVPGTVTQVGNIGFGLVPDADPGTRYAPTEPLDEEFQHDGLRVRFSGLVGDPNDTGRGGRRWGTPLEVTVIERIDADEDP